MLLNRHGHPSRKGWVAALVAVGLVGLIGILALALDGGALLAERRHAQAVADAAALAAAADLYNNYGKNKGLDPQGTAAESAKTTAAANGYTNDGTTSVVTVNIPPQSGDYAGQAGYAEVIVVYNQQSGFSGIYGNNVLPVHARAVAQGSKAPSNIGVLLLNPSAKGALTISGSAGMTVDGRVIVDSSSSTAATSSGSAGLKSTEMDITGNYSSSGSSFFQANPVNTGASATADFLADLPTPDPSTMPVRSTSTYKASSGDVLQPGVYMGGISISSQPNVTLSPGIYYLEGGGFTMSGGSSTLTANGVMLYNGADSGGNTGPITVSGGGKVTMTPIASAPYDGIAIFQDRSSTQPITLSGGSAWGFTGTVYAAKAHVDVSGSSGATMGSQYISDTLNLSGSSAFNDIDPSKGYGARQIRLVE